MPPFSEESQNTQMWDSFDCKRNKDTGLNGGKGRCCNICLAKVNNNATTQNSKLYLVQVVKCHVNGLFEVACVSVTDTDSHHFGVDLKRWILLLFHPIKVPLCRLLQASIAQQGQCCKA